MIAFAYFLGLAFFVAIIFVAIFYVKYYQNRHDAEPLPTVVTIIAISVSLFCLFLIPVDIYSFSSTSDFDTGLPIVSPDVIERRSALMQVLYFSFYGILLVFSFGLVPFSYFYYEEADEDVTKKQRIWAGLKYTLFLLLIMIIIFVIGLLLKPGEHPDIHGNAKQWIDSLLTTNPLEYGITFALTCLTMIGFFVWCSYTAVGLSSLPLNLLKGKRHYLEEITEVQFDEEETKMRRGAISSKYLGTRRLRMSQKDEDEVNLLRRREMLISERKSRLENQNKGINKLFIIFRPFTFLIGLFFLLVNIVLILSIALTQIDKLLNSLCGSSCGFITSTPELINPLDQFLVLLAKYFPLDYIVMALIILYIFFATLSGIRQLGIRFLWIKLYSVREKRTPPQALLLSAILLMFALLCLNFEMVSLAPRYSTFGTQTYLNNVSEIVPCDMNAPLENCTMTEIATIVNQVFLKVSFFGVFFYGAMWVFILVWIIGFLYNIYKKRDSTINITEDDFD